MIAWLVGLLVSREFYQRLNNNISGIHVSRELEYWLNDCLVGWFTCES